MDELERVSRSARRIARIRALLDAAIAARDAAIRDAHHSGHYRTAAIREAAQVKASLFWSIVAPSRK